MRRTHDSLWVFALGVIVASVPVRADLIYVEDSATNGLNNGSSWENAYLDLQDALAAASTNGTGTEIRVAGGVYKPDRGTGNRLTAFVLRTGVALYGGYAGLANAVDPDVRDTDLYESVLSGDLAGNDGPDFANHEENACRVLVGSATDATAVLDGFTISGGYADVSGYDLGGGLYVYGGAPTIRHCAFRLNQASIGGAVYSWNGHPVFEDCSFTGNVAMTTAGAVYLVRGQAILRRCTIADNRSDDAGGVLSREGAHGFYDCTFIHNVADDHGGGMWNYDADAWIVNCLFLGNRAPDGGALADTYFSASRVINSVFVGNYAYYGGAILESWTTSAITNCVIVANKSGIHNSWSSPYTTDPVITNCIVWGNGSGSAQNQISTDHVNHPVVNYSLVQGGWSGAGGSHILNVDPRFRRNPYDGGDGWDPADYDDDYGDLRLRPFSPAIDAGNRLVDVDPVTPGVQALPATDLDGHVRTVDDPTAPNAGSSPAVDLGPYEYQEDCNSNAALDSADLLSGTSEDCNGDGIPDECSGDCNSNGTWDACDIFFGTAIDCDSNGVPDPCDITTDPTRDADSNGVLDRCERALTGYWRFDFTADTGCYLLDQFLTQVRYFRFDAAGALVECWALEDGHYLRWHYPSTDGPSLNRYLLEGGLTANTDRAVTIHDFKPYAGTLVLQETVSVNDGSHNEESEETPEAGVTDVEGWMNADSTSMVGEWEFRETWATFCGLFTAMRLAGPPPDLPYVVDVEMAALVLNSTELLHPGAAEVVQRSYRIRGSFLSQAIEIRYLLSADTTQDDGDILVGTESIDADPAGRIGLHSGGGPTLSVPPCVPPSATYYILAVADAGDAVLENDESNNLVAVQVTLDPPPRMMDLDCDGSVDLDDYALLVGCYTGPFIPSPADADEDADVDLADVALWETCLGGPRVPATGGCENGDFDADTDVDFADFAVLQGAFTGSEGPLSPACRRADAEPDHDVDLADMARFQEAFAGP